MSCILQMAFGNGPAISMFLKQQNVTKTNQQAQESGSPQLDFVFCLNIYSEIITEFNVLPRRYSET